MWLCKFWIIINNSVSRAFLLLALVVQRHCNWFQPHFRLRYECDFCWDYGLWYALHIMWYSALKPFLLCANCQVGNWFGRFNFKTTPFFASGDQTEIWQPVKVDNCGCESLALVMSGIPINWICIFFYSEIFSWKGRMGNVDNSLWIWGCQAEPGSVVLYRQQKSTNFE